MKKILFSILFGLAVFTQSNGMFLSPADEIEFLSEINPKQNFEIYEDPSNDELHSFFYDSYVKNHKILYKKIKTTVINLSKNQNLKETSKKLQKLNVRIQALKYYANEHKDVKSINYLEENFNIPESVKILLYNQEIQSEDLSTVLKRFYLASLINIERENKLTNEEFLNLAYKFCYNDFQKLEDDSYKKQMSEWLLSKAKDLINKIDTSNVEIENLLREYHNSDEMEIDNSDKMEIDNPNDEYENVSSENEQ